MTATRTARFQALLEEHKRLLYKVCYAYAREPSDRDELAQEIAVQLWRAFPSFDERARFSTWMYRIALNVAISAYRRERTRTRYIVSADEHLLDVVDDREPPSEDLNRLYALIEGLEPLERALLLLYLDGHSHAEIADVLGIREGNVATKINRLKGTLRDAAQARPKRSTS
jgi:RNA polymerase sigma-70 factor (ECF subfamily)